MVHHLARSVYISTHYGISLQGVYKFNFSLIEIIQHLNSLVLTYKSLSRWNVLKSCLSLYLFHFLKIPHISPFFEVVGNLAEILIHVKTIFLIWLLYCFYPFFHFSEDNFHHVVSNYISLFLYGNLLRCQLLDIGNWLFSSVSTFVVFLFYMGSVILKDSVVGVNILFRLWMWQHILRRLVHCWIVSLHLRVVSRHSYLLRSFAVIISLKLLSFL